MTVDRAKHENTAFAVYAADAGLADRLTDRNNITDVYVEIAQMCVPCLNAKPVIQNDVIAKGVTMPNGYHFSACQRGNCCSNGS